MLLADYIARVQKVFGTGERRTEAEAWEWGYAKHKGYVKMGAKLPPFDVTNAPDEFLERHPELMQGNR